MEERGAKKNVYFNQINKKNLSGHSSITDDHHMSDLDS